MSDITQIAFNGGIISDELAHREDLPKVQTGVSICRNMIVRASGAIETRGGFKKMYELPDGKQRLIPFVPSRDSSYVTSWGNLGLSFFKAGVMTLRSIRSATYKWTLSADGTSNYYLELAAGGDPGLLETQFVLEDGVEMAAGTLGSLAASETAFGDSSGDALGYDTFYVRLSDSTDPDGKAAAYVQIPYLIATPYTSAQNKDIDTAQSADVMYLTNKIAMPYKLTRVSDAEWTLALMDLEDGPWIGFEDGDEEIVMTPSAKTGSGVTVTCNETFPYPNSNGTGGIIRFGYENPFDTSIIEYGWATITAAPSSTTRTVTIEKDLGFEYLLNPEFTNDIGFWRDESTAGSDSTATHDSVTGTLQLNKGTTGEALVRQEVSVPKFERMTFEIVVDVVDTSLKVFIGTTIGGTDVLASQTITTPGTYSYTTEVNEPQITTVYVTIWTNGAPVSSTHNISKTSLMRKGLATPHWRIGTFSADNTYPSHIALFENALYLAGGSLNLSDTFWKSKIGDYEKFSFNTPPIDTDAVGVTLGSKQVNAIQHITPFGELVIGTTGQEWRVEPGPNSGTITATSISANAKSNTGSAAVAPVIIKNSLIFLGQNSDKIYSLSYSFDADGYRPMDLTRFAPHLFEGYTITEWAVQKSPNSILWCVRNDGVLLGLTYLEASETLDGQPIWAWHSHDTQGLIESVCVVPESGEDVVYVSVNRKKTIGGFKVTKRYLEKMMPSISDADIYDYNLLDNSYTVDIENDIASSASINGITYLAQAIPAGETVNKEHIRVSYPLVGPIPIQENDYIYISGLVGPDALNGKTYRASDLSSGGGNLYFLLKDKEGDDYVDGKQLDEWVSGGEVRKGITSVFFDGLKYSDGTVGVMADGSYSVKNVTSTGTPASAWGFDLDEPAIVIHCGLLYDKDVKTLPHDFISDVGANTQGKNKVLAKVNVILSKSTGLIQIGPDEDNLQDRLIKKGGSGNNPNELFTGVIEQKVNDGSGKTAQTFIRSPFPFPMTIGGIISDVSFSEE